MGFYVAGEDGEISGNMGLCHCVHAQSDGSPSIGCPSYLQSSGDAIQRRGAFLRTPCLNSLSNNAIRRWKSAVERTVLSARLFTRWVPSSSTMSASLSLFYKCSLQSTNSVVAVKKISSAFLIATLAKRSLREVTIVVCPDGQSTDESRNASSDPHPEAHSTWEHRLSHWRLHCSEQQRETPFIDECSLLIDRVLVTSTS